MTQWTGGRPLEVLTFDLLGERFAIEATHVHEILDLVPVTEVPNSEPFVNGLINVRGKVVPLADLRLKLGMKPEPPTIDSRIVVVEIRLDGDTATVAIRADKVYEIAQVPATAIEETPRVGMRWRTDYIRCIAKHGADFVAVLDIDRLFAGDGGHEEHSPAGAFPAPRNIA